MTFRPSPTRSLVGALAGLLTLCLLPGEAHACDACVCYANHEQPWALPDATRNVPLNLRMFVWLRGMDPGTLALSTWAGEQVSFALTPAGITDAQRAGHRGPR